MDHHINQEKEVDLTTIEGLQTKTLFLIFEGIDCGVRRAHPEMNDEINSLLEVFAHGICVQHENHFFSGINEIVSVLRKSLIACHNAECTEYELHGVFEKSLDVIMKAPQDAMELRLIQTNM